MAIDEGLVGWVVESLAPIGTVTMRRMMGGATLYCDGTIFAIFSQDALWFKADAASDAFWDGQNCPRISFDMPGRGVVSMNSRRAPDEVHDDADAMQRWAVLALEAGRRAPVRRKRRTTRSRKGTAGPDS
ncbi:MAG: TfoX/Sxy family protein [Sphingobium sp.]